MLLRTRSAGTYLIVRLAGNLALRSGTLLRARTAARGRPTVAVLTHRRGAVRTHGPCRLERMMAARAEVLQARVAVRTQHVVGLDRIAAVRTLAVLHKLALLQGNLEFLLVAIDLQQRRTKQAVRDDADKRHERDDAPNVPMRPAHVGVADDPHDRKNIKHHKQHDEDRERCHQFRRNELRHQFGHGFLVSSSRRFKALRTTSE